MTAHTIRDCTHHAPLFICICILLGSHFTNPSNMCSKTVLIVQKPTAYMTSGVLQVCTCHFYTLQNITTQNFWDTASTIPHGQLHFMLYSHLSMLLILDLDNSKTKQAIAIASWCCNNEQLITTFYRIAPTSHTCFNYIYILLDSFKNPSNVI